MPSLHWPLEGGQLRGINRLRGLFLQSTVTLASSHPGVHNKSICHRNWFSLAFRGSGNVRECALSMDFSPIFYVQWVYGVDIVFLFLQTAWNSVQIWLNDGNEGINGYFSPLPCLVQCVWILHYGIISCELKKWIFMMISWDSISSRGALITFPTLKFCDSVSPQLEY